MKNGRRIIANIIYIVLGVILLGLSMMEHLDSFWSGMGSALLTIGIIRMVQMFRYQNNQTYREEKILQANDERNQFLRNKAWAWSGYLFVLIAAILTIVFKLLNQDLLSMAAASAVCILILLYCLCFSILQRKY